MYSASLQNVLDATGYKIPDNIKDYANQHWIKAYQKIDNITGNVIGAEWVNLTPAQKNQIGMAFAIIFEYYFQKNEQWMANFNLSSTQGAVSQSITFNEYPEYVPATAISLLTRAGVLKNIKSLNLDGMMYDNNSSYSVYNGYYGGYAGQPISARLAYQLFTQKYSFTSQDNTVKITTGENPQYPTVDLSVADDVKQFVDYDKFLSGTSNVSWVKSVDSEGRHILSLHVTSGGQGGKQIDTIQAPLAYNVPAKTLSLNIDQGTLKTTANALAVKYDTASGFTINASGLAINIDNKKGMQFVNGTLQPFLGKNLSFNAQTGAIDAAGGGGGGWTPSSSTLGTALAYGGTPAKLDVKLAPNSGLKKTNGLAIDTTSFVANYLVGGINSATNSWISFQSSGGATPKIQGSILADGITLLANGGTQNRSLKLRDDYLTYAITNAGYAGSTNFQIAATYDATSQQTYFLGIVDGTTIGVDTSTQAQGVLHTIPQGLIKGDYLHILNNKITFKQSIVDKLNKTDTFNTRITNLEQNQRNNASLWQIKDLGSSGQEVQLKTPRQLFMHNKIIYGVGDATNSSEAVNLGVLTKKITPIQTKANKNETDINTNKTTLATLSTSVSDLQTKQVQDRTKINNIESIAVGKDQFTGQANELTATHTLTGTNAVKYSFAPTFRTKIASFVPRDNFITGFGTKVTHDSSRNEVKYEIHHSPLDFGFDAQKRLILAPFFKEKVNDLPQRTRTDRLTKDFSGIGATFIFEFDPTWEDYLTLEPSIIDVDFAITPKGANRDTFHLRTRIHTGDFDVSGGLGFPTGSTGNNSYTFNLVNNANYSGLSPEVYGNTAITFQAPSAGVSKWRMFYRGPALSTGRNPYNPDDTTVYAYKKITITLTRYADYWGVFI